MQYSAKLKRVIHEIKQILDSNDIAGLVILHENGFGEFHLKLDPSYSIATLKGDELRFKASLKNDFNGNKKLMEYKLTCTANMMAVLTDLTGRYALNLIEASEKLDKILDARHGDGSIISQLDLDN